jgi:cation diffusion facilitator family transporter
MAHGHIRAIYIAAGANLAIAVAKFGGSFVSGSAAMFAEGVHSLVDTINQILLLVGIRRASRAADERHPFGYGREVYFFAFVVALFIFLGGGVFAIYEGWHKINHPEAEGSATLAGYVVTGFWLNIAVLSFAIATEGYSELAALRAFRAEVGGAPILRSIRQSKDSSLFTVLLEDAAAFAGLCIATSGVVLARVFEMPALDGLVSVGIGLLLVAVAALLLIETHGLLIGETADPTLVAAVRAAVADNAGVQAVHEVLTQHMGPRDILLAISADMDDALTAGQIEAWVSALEHRIRTDFPRVTRVFIGASARNCRLQATEG